MTTEITMQHLQQRVDDYIGQFKEGYFPPFELLARLTEELGELSREVQDVYGQKRKRQQRIEGALKKSLGTFFRPCMLC